MHGPDLERVVHVQRARARLGRRHAEARVVRAEVGERPRVLLVARDARGVVAVGLVVAGRDHVRDRIGARRLHLLEERVPPRFVAEPREAFGVQERVVGVRNVARVPPQLDVVARLQVRDRRPALRAARIRRREVAPHREFEVAPLGSGRRYERARRVVAVDFVVVARAARQRREHGVVVEPRAREVRDDRARRRGVERFRRRAVAHARVDALVLRAPRDGHAVGASDRDVDLGDRRRGGAREKERESHGAAEMRSDCALLCPLRRGSGRWSSENGGPGARSRVPIAASTSGALGRVSPARRAPR